MIFGYVRVSKSEQNQDLQFDALRKAGCEKIFHEKVSGASKERPEYVEIPAKQSHYSGNLSRSVD